MKSNERRRCPACEASNQRGAVGIKNGFEILVCGECLTIYTGKLPESEELEDYDEYYTEANLMVPAFIAERVNDIVGGFEPYRQTNRLLDVGFGAGTILESAVNQKWQSFGIEVSRPAVEQARSRGFEAFHGSLVAAAYPDDYFDVITASEILEHLSSPQEELHEIARILRPGGMFWATTPSARGISFRLMKLNWSVLSPPEHTQLYSKKGVLRMMRNAGFQDVAIYAFGMNPVEIINHFRSSRSSSPPFNRVETAYALNERLMKSPLKRLLKSAANTTLNLLGLGDSLKIYAQKP
jgi:2-polyprenyl-3-methyl-5-hydroxy-6-metoxy-1,4-benzoquinol methylase